MTHFDQLILEGKFLFDMTAQPVRDYIPKVEEKVARENERRVREGLPLFELDWDSRYVEEDTMFFDAHTLCSCGERLTGEETKCDACILRAIRSLEAQPSETIRLLYGGGL